MCCALEGNCCALEGNCSAVCLLLCFGRDLMCCVLAVVLWKGIVVLRAGCCALEGNCCALCWLLCFGRELLCCVLAVREPDKRITHDQS